ncbi:Uncharacterized protein HZ326_20237 [Fusarium oxysporum f. sp. albedinis]|nr:Uncharacterized protein HZ326_20237 [Fusarium oxysporum f. sp. albedinis]
MGCLAVRAEGQQAFRTQPRSRNECFAKYLLPFSASSQRYTYSYTACQQQPPTLTSVAMLLSESDAILLFASLWPIVLPQGSAA